MDDAMLTPHAQSSVGCLVLQTWGGQLHEHITHSAVIESGCPTLVYDARQFFVRPNRCVLKLPRLLTEWWWSFPLKLPGESCRKRSCNDAQGLLGELGILLYGFRESKAVQLRVDLNRLHATIIPSRVEELLRAVPLRTKDKPLRRLNRCVGNLKPRFSANLINDNLGCGPLPYRRSPEPNPDSAPPRHSASRPANGDHIPPRSRDYARW